MQNNEAAARYRKRQRDAKTVVEGEIDQLLERNFELRREIHLVESEIAELKQSLSLRQDIRLVEGIDDGSPTPPWQPCDTFPLEYSGSSDNSNSGKNEPL